MTSERGELAAKVTIGVSVASIIASGSFLGYDAIRDTSCETIPQYEIENTIDRLADLPDGDKVDTDTSVVRFVTDDGAERRMRIAESFGFTLYDSRVEYGQIAKADEISDIRQATSALGKVYGFDIFIDDETNFAQTRSDALALTRNLQAYPVEVMQKAGPNEMHIGATMSEDFAGLHTANQTTRFSAHYSDSIQLRPDSPDHTFHHEHGHAWHAVACGAGEYTEDKQIASLNTIPYGAAEVSSDFSLANDEYANKNSAEDFAETVEGIQEGNLFPKDGSLVDRNSPAFQKAGYAIARLNNLEVDGEPVGRYGDFILATVYNK